MITIALATFQGEPNLFRDEAPLIHAFDKRGILAIPVIWNRPSIDWSEFDAVIIRNTWDYHQRPEVFLAWLNQLETLNMPVINPPALIRWNMDKRYLQALSKVRIMPTVFCDDDSAILADILQAQGWEKAVVKPVISASGENTWQLRIDSANEFQHNFEKIVSPLGAMIQPFMPQIADGEWSFVFFEGEYSHTVLKVPAENNMFTHEERGARLNLVEPSQPLIEQAQAVIDTAKQLTGIMPSYARVDGILDADDFVLMELECIEPELYFSRCEGASERFVDVILKALF